MSTPRVESPRLDSYRYSLINLEETLENDLGMCENWKILIETAINEPNIKALINCISDFKLIN